MNADKFCQPEFVRDESKHLSDLRLMCGADPFKRGQTVVVRQPARRRGRPASTNPANQFVCVRLTDAERADLTRIALENGQSLTAFIREAIAEAVSDCTDEPVLSPR